MNNLETELLSALRELRENAHQQNRAVRNIDCLARALVQALAVSQLDAASVFSADELEAIENASPFPMFPNE